MTATPKTATTAEIAAELQTTPRELRKFLRSQGSGVGKGSRYALPANKAEMTKMRKNFSNWTNAQDAAKAAKKAESDKAPKGVNLRKETEATIIDDQEESVDSLDDLEGPSDDELLDALDD